MNKSLFKINENIFVELVIINESDIIITSLPKIQKHNKLLLYTYARNEKVINA